MRVTSFVLGLGALGLIAGCSTSSSNPSDGSPPMVQITAPVDQAMVGGQVSFDANVTDDFGVDVVHFYVDGTIVSTQYTPPFHYLWNTASLADQSLHELKVDAMDLAKNLGIQTIHVTIARGTSSPPGGF